MKQHDGIRGQRSGVVSIKCGAQQVTANSVTQVLYNNVHCQVLQCFDAVGWAARRAYGL